MGLQFSTDLDPGGNLRCASLALALTTVYMDSTGICGYINSRRDARGRPKSANVVLLLTLDRIRLADYHYFFHQTLDDRGLDAFHPLGPCHQIPVEAYRPLQRTDP